MRSRPSILLKQHALLSRFHWLSLHSIEGISTGEGGLYSVQLHNEVTLNFTRVFIHCIVTLTHTLSVNLGAFSC